MPGPECYAFEGESLASKRCTNRAVYYWEEKYDDPDIIGTSYMQLCESCYEEIVGEKHRHFWKKLLLK